MTSSPFPSGPHPGAGPLARSDWDMEEDLATGLAASLAVSPSTVERQVAPGVLWITSDDDTYGCLSFYRGPELATEVIASDAWRGLSGDSLKRLHHLCCYIEGASPPAVPDPHSLSGMTGIYVVPEGPVVLARYGHGWMTYKVASETEPAFLVD